ncbi:MAG: hypothetical protein ACR2QL_09715, partial [Woeseiaceae bacterium]
MRSIGVLITILGLPWLAMAQTDPVRSKTTLNSGIPLSEAQLAFSVEHYELRNEILPASKSLIG